MKIASASYFRCVLLVFCLTYANIMIPGLASGQSKREQLEKHYGISVAEATDQLKSGKITLIHLDLIGQSGALDAIPDLRKQFTVSQDEQEKAKIAQVLVKLGEKDNKYWEYLSLRARRAVESDAPDVFIHDGQGKVQSGLSPEFILWAKSHGDLADSAQEIVYINPAMVRLLGATMDQRAIPLLRKALLSPNYLVENAGAEGLAELQDKDSIPLIIEAVKKAPAEAGMLLAQSLVYFDDPQAQLAVDTYIPAEFARLLRAAKAKGRRPFHEEFTTSK